tara:strand:- start:150661 stop:151392 length:732 start_codon:yes stop_codon:yes gene_type:complete
MISVKNLSKIYEPDGFIAVNHIDFEIPTGSIACIIGTSGCGKTTTLKMLNRLVEPSTGEIRVNNELAITYDPVEWRRKIGYVIQKAGLLPHMTVRENITLLSRILKRDKKHIVEKSNELLNMIGMDPNTFADRYPIELSGGQQQRVGIARALMEDPPILLMDEPFGALDPITRNSMHEELMYMNEKLHKTIVIVTHDMEEAFKLGNQVMLMNKGEIIQMGNEKDFKENPKNQFVEDFVSGQLG